MKIRTSYVFPPIPDRNHDWSAIDEGSYEPGLLADVPPQGDGQARVSSTPSQWNSHWYLLG
jgi:hypothetical protein